MVVNFFSRSLKRRFSIFCFFSTNLGCNLRTGVCRHVPLYLEWAPVNLLTGVKKSRVYLATENSKEAVGDKELKRAVVETRVAALTEDDDVDQARSVFVKNLNFSTTEDSLKKHFQQKINQRAVRSVTVSS